MTADFRRSGGQTLFATAVAEGAVYQHDVRWRGGVPGLRRCGHPGHRHAKRADQHRGFGEKFHGLVAVVPAFRRQGGDEWR